MPNNSTETRAVPRPPSDGSELIPAEAPRNSGNDVNMSLNKPLAEGYTVSDEGIINNYAVEPDLQPADYPSPYQQRRYLLQGAIAMVFVAFMIWVAFAVS
ncbi:ssl1498 family light-harvesting-like protein [Crocosphaera sp. UHCC 0190]|uniref:photosystem II assembly protein Psb34 n=1 Tax=Crocosphaera sp. UHCC 0190 TaxID=3110246 RepID=UPI002B21E699|nr:ssl1498 family light-harvesting-like protein [Crocosphaera sp. UHCC 0190]MEA5509183.1 ssl1498 family light-harvesting-like protein [Crocosphaera sp. UHCC 0190]